MNNTDYLLAPKKHACSVCEVVCVRTCVRARVRAGECVRACWWVRDIRYYTIFTQQIDVNKISLSMHLCTLLHRVSLVAVWCNAFADVSTLKNYLEGTTHELGLALPSNTHINTLTHKYHLNILQVMLLDFSLFAAWNSVPLRCIHNERTNCQL